MRAHGRRVAFAAVAAVLVVLLRLLAVAPPPPPPPPPPPLQLWRAATLAALRFNAGGVGGVGGGVGRAREAAALVRAGERALAEPRVPRPGMERFAARCSALAILHAMAPDDGAALSALHDQLDAWIADGSPGNGDGDGDADVDADGLGSMVELLDATALVYSALRPSTAAALRRWYTELASRLATPSDAANGRTRSARAAARIAIYRWLGRDVDARAAAHAALPDLAADLLARAPSGGTAAHDATTHALVLLAHLTAATLLRGGPAGAAKLEPVLSALRARLDAISVNSESAHGRRWLQLPLRLGATLLDDVAPLQTLRLLDLPIDALADGGAVLASPPSALGRAEEAFVFVYHRAGRPALSRAATGGTRTVDVYVCAMAANIVQLQMLAQSAFPGAVPDMVVLTDPSETEFFTADERRLLEDDLGVRIIHSAAARTYNSSGNISCQGDFLSLDFLRANFLKIDAFCLPYRAVHYLDIDNFITFLDPTFWSLLGPVSTCYTWGGASTPFVGHEFMTLPTPESCQRIRAAGAGGFSPTEGWAHAGPVVPVWENCRCPRNTSLATFRKMGLPIPDTGDFPRHCYTDTGLTDWGFYGSCTDQGILYWECAIARKTGQITPNSDFEKRMRARHYYGSRKPWNDRASPGPVYDRDEVYRQADALARQVLPSYARLCQ